MTRPNSHFQPIAELPSEHGFTLWGYGTRDDLRAVASPGYFQGYNHHMKRGDLLLVNAISGGSRRRPQVMKMLYHVDMDLDGQVHLHEVAGHGLLAGIEPAGVEVASLADAIEHERSEPQ